MDIDLSTIVTLTTREDAMKEFYGDSGMEDFFSSSFDRPGFWVIQVTFGEGDEAVYLGEDISGIADDLLNFSEYGVNYDPLGENPGNLKFETIVKKDRLILCSHPDSDPDQDCDIFLRIS